MCMSRSKRRSVKPAVPTANFNPAFSRTPATILHLDIPIAQVEAVRVPPACSARSPALQELPAPSSMPLPLHTAACQSPVRATFVPRTASLPGSTAHTPDSADGTSAQRLPITPPHAIPGRPQTPPAPPPATATPPAACAPSLYRPRIAELLIQLRNPRRIFRRPPADPHRPRYLPPKRSHNLIIGRPLHPIHDVILHRLLFSGSSLNPSCSSQGVKE